MPPAQPADHGDTKERYVKRFNFNKPSLFDHAEIHHPNEGGDERSIRAKTRARHGDKNQRNGLIDSITKSRNATMRYVNDLQGLDPETGVEKEIKSERKAAKNAQPAQDRYTALVQARPGRTILRLRGSGGLL